MCIRDSDAVGGDVDVDAGADDRGAVTAGGTDDVRAWASFEDADRTE